MRGVFSASVVAVVLALTSCTLNQPQAAPEATPSTPAVSTTPSTAPTPTDTPTPSTAPSAAPSPSPAKLIITSVNFHMGEVGLAYGTVTAGAAGGVKPYKWSISSGALPAGLALSKAGGSTTGKPTAPGTFSFVIRVDDSAGGAAGVPRSIFVFRQIAFTHDQRGKCSDIGNAGLYDPQLKYTGGASNATPKDQSSRRRAGDPALPPGSTITAKAGVVTGGSIFPARASMHRFLHRCVLVLVDPSPCGANFRCSSAPAHVDDPLRAYNC